MSKTELYPLALISALSLCSLFSFSANATIVEFQTSHGNFKINLHDETTPKTVENFLEYVKDGDYNNTVVHRLIPDFIIQAGGFSFEGNLPLTPISTDSPVKNEPIFSSVKGTIAMAKPSSNANGATSQWFINYKDNSANLDVQNGGFTVFGEVIENGMQTLDAIATLPICNETPMPDYTNIQCADANYVPGTDNFVIIHSVTIIDNSTKTDASLTPIKNVLINQDTSSSNSGGAFSYGIFAVLSLLAFRRKIKTL
jgi:cyclophilin family peptidyl-prolyl cis-trans isomerase